MVQAHLQVHQALLVSCKQQQAGNAEITNITMISCVLDEALCEQYTTDAPQMLAVVATQLLQAVTQGQPRSQRHQHDAQQQCLLHV